MRDIASGLFVFILMAAGATQLLGWVILAATIIPLADATIVLANRGSKSIALGCTGNRCGHARDRGAPPHVLSCITRPGCARFDSSSSKGFVATYYSDCR